MPPAYPYICNSVALIRIYVLCNKLAAACAFVKHQSNKPVKSSQVANFHRHNQMRQAKSPAQQNNERRVRRAYAAADIKSPGTPPVYGTGWTNFPWADRLMAGVPTRESIPLLYLLHYHKADVTSQTRVLLRQNDAIHCAHQISRAQDPKRRCPG